MEVTAAVAVVARGAAVLLGAVAGDGVGVGGRGGGDGVSVGDSSTIVVGAEAGVGTGAAPRSIAASSAMSLRR